MLVSPIRSLSRPFHHSWTVMILECKTGWGLTTNQHCVTFEKINDFVYTMVEAWNLAQYKKAWSIIFNISTCWQHDTYISRFTGYDLYNQNSASGTVGFLHHVWAPRQLLMEDPSPLQQPVCENEHSHLSSAVVVKQQGVWSPCCLCPHGVLLKSHGNFTIYLFW
jgi:hypothetical protein